MNERYSRNEALFGAAGQSRIANTRVAIACLGGLGSHVAQQLAYLGVVDYVLIDFDVVTESSLNRVVWAVPTDTNAATKKANVAERAIKAVQPEARVDVLDVRVSDGSAKTAVSSADVVFGNAWSLGLPPDVAGSATLRLCAGRLVAQPALSGRTVQWGRSAPGTSADKVHADVAYRASQSRGDWVGRRPAGE